MCQYFIVQVATQRSANRRKTFFLGSWPCAREYLDISRPRKNTRQQQAHPNTHTTLRELSLDKGRRLRWAHRRSDSQHYYYYIQQYTVPLGSSLTTSSTNNAVHHACRFHFERQGRAQKSGPGRKRPAADGRSSPRHEPTMRWGCGRCTDGQRVFGRKRRKSQV